jgi:hypothetical protein
MNALKRARAYALALMGALCLLAVVSPAQAAGGGCLPASLKQKLNEVRAKFGRIEIVSAHRPGARIAGSGRRSYHASCRAVDFNPPKGKYSQVVAYLNSHHSGGLGTYTCGMHHIHIDNGPRVRFHKCQNGNRVVYSQRGLGGKFASNSNSKRYAKRGGKRHYASKGRGRHYAQKSSGRRYASKSHGKRYASKAKSRVYASRSTKRRYSNRVTGKRYSSAQRARHAVETAMLTKRSLGSVYASRN